MADLGSDLAGVLDITATLSTVSGLRALAEQILRRLTTPRGRLIKAAEYGFDIRGLIGSTAAASFVEHHVFEQIMEEEEVSTTQVSVSFIEQTGQLDISADVVTAQGPFSLTILASSDLTLELFLNGETVGGS